MNGFVRGWGLTFLFSTHQTAKKWRIVLLFLPVEVLYSLWKKGRLGRMKLISKECAAPIFRKACESKASNNERMTNELRRAIEKERVLIPREKDLDQSSIIVRIQSLSWPWDCWRFSIMYVSPSLSFFFLSPSLSRLSLPLSLLFSSLSPSLSV